MRCCLSFVICYLCVIVVGVVDCRITGSSSSSLTSTTNNESTTTTTTNSISSRLSQNLFRNGTSTCERIHPEELPEECTCYEPGKYSLIIECAKPFNDTYVNDTIGLKINIQPCNPEGSSVSLDITEKKHAIDYKIVGVRAGEVNNVPIPGLAVMVPGIGHVGIDAAINIGGNPDSLLLKIGLNACIAFATHTTCASSIPGLNKILPWYVLQGTFSFGDICDSQQATRTNQTTTSRFQTSASTTLLTSIK